MAAIEPDESAGDYGCYRIKGEYSIYFADIRDELRNGGTFKVKQGILERTPSFTIWIESITDDDLYFIAKEWDFYFCIFNRYKKKQCDDNRKC